MVIVESGWGSILPTVILASMLNTGPAARSGKLSVGDQIMSINDTSLVGLPLATCQGIIKVWIISGISIYQHRTALTSVFLWVTGHLGFWSELKLHPKLVVPSTESCNIAQKLHIKHPASLSSILFYMFQGLKNQVKVKLSIVSCPPVTTVLIKRPDLKFQLGFSVQNGIVSISPC